MHSMLDLITVVGGDSTDALATPEIYDATVISLQLLLVLCGTQLYQPFVSSFQTQPDDGYENYILDELLKDESSWGGETVAAKNYALFYASSRSSLSYSNHRDGKSSRRRQHVWTPHSVLSTCMEWQMRRPMAPKRSIAHYYFTMAQVAVAARGGESLASDGMYESYMIVHATAPQVGNAPPGSDAIPTSTSSGASHAPHHRHGNHNVILDATRGVFLLGSSIILLPFRLMSLVFGIIASGHKNRGGGDAQLLARKIKSWSSSRTRDVLWLSDSILADLANCIVLLLVNNRRNGTNAFRSQLERLVDNRWEHDTDPANGLPDLPRIDAAQSEDDSISMEEIESENSETNPLGATDTIGGGLQLTVNFERLYEAFGRTLHTEVGALMLYTLYQTSPTFAESLVVRSDLDMLVLPLLRTLYFSSSTKTYVATDFVSRKDKTDFASTMKLDIRSCPFRSQSQLYVIMILLLLFSQDSSFGRDAFRRINVLRVPWYKERNLRNINLGSVILLTLLRSLMFNLQRLQDAFLLSNCCAVLQNMSPPVVDLHEYAAMRLASVTVSVMKKHLRLHASSTGQSTKAQKPSAEAEGYMSTPLSMYEEVALTLLGIIHHCFSPKSVDRNLHLVYAMIYHQADFIRVLNEKKLYPKKLLDRIQAVTQEASAIIQEEGARTAPKALNVLEENIDRLQNLEEKKRKKERDDITFTYEEEADPEIFFVPYVWETIVCVVTSSSIEWRKDDIKVFSLLDPLDNVSAIAGDIAVEVSAEKFSKGAEELV